MPETECCAACIYWDGLHSLRRTATTATGKCRRFPPTMGTQRVEWPLTESMDWCGEFDDDESFEISSEQSKRSDVQS